MSNIIFLTTVADTTTPTTIYGQGQVSAITDEAMVRAFNREGKAALIHPDPRGIRVAATTTTTAQIAWTVDQPSTGMAVDYGTTTALGSNQAATPAAGTGAIVANLTGLTTNTLYYYRVFALNATGTAANYSPTLSFRTL